MMLHPSTVRSTSAAPSAEERVAANDWVRIASDLDGYGCAIFPLLTAAECREIAALYSEPSHFRSHIIMARHGFGKGEYRYFNYPLPDLIRSVRTALYPRLAGVANDWNERMGMDRRFPADHASYLRQCHDAGQTRPTPLLLQYVPGDFNCLHQDLYGDLWFPIQVAILLSEPGRDFTGGEFALTEQRPRMQSRVEVVSMRQGDAVAFAVTTGRSGERRAIIASACVTASAASAQGCVTPSGSSSTMRDERTAPQAARRRCFLSRPDRCLRHRLRIDATKGIAPAP